MPLAGGEEVEAQSSFGRNALRSCSIQYRQGVRKDMQRVAFMLKVKPNMIEEYKRRHAAVWPEMLQALRETGWHNYSLFLRDDGLLVGYFETEDLEAAR